MSAHHVEKKSSFFVNNKHIPAIPFILLGLVLCGIGGITALMVFFKGHEAMYGVTREIPWGMLIATYAYFVITSTGLAFIGGLGHAFGFEKFNKIGKRIVVMAFIVLLAGFTQILMEIGHPIRMMIYMILSPNLKAPILWMGVFYGIELGILAVELWLVFKPNPSEGDHKLAAIAGFFALLIGTLATSNLGYVFGSLNARAFYHGIYFSTFLVISGITAGAALLMLVHNIVYKGNIPSDLYPTFKSLSKLMGGGIGMMMFLYLWKILSSLYTEPGDAYLAVLAMLKGPLSVNFWIGEMGLAIVIPLLILAGTKGNNPKASGLAGFLFMIGLFFTRFDFIVAGQMPPMRAGLPGSGVETVNGLATYSPSLGEWGIYMLGFGVFFLLYFAAERFLNLETEAHH
jgi:molybdopterin-containing oxidoreductase family membrane subunit